MKLTAHDMPRSYWRSHAESNGINRSTFDNRVRRGWSPDKAASEPPEEGKGWKSTGQTDAEVSRAHGLHWESVRKWRRRHGDDETPAEAIAQRLVERHTRETLKDKALAAGLDPRTVWDRMRRGWSEERALSTPAQKPGATIHANRKRAKPDA